MIRIGPNQNTVFKSPTTHLCGKRYNSEIIQYPHMYRSQLKG